MIYIGTGITENYVQKAQHFYYFDTLNLVAGGYVKAFTVLLDFSDAGAASMAQRFPNIRFIRMSSSEVKAMNPNRCIQHGAFIDRLQQECDLASDHFVIFTDSDITIQRKLEPEEFRLLEEGKIFVAPNWHDGETLAEELPSLQPRVPLPEFERCFPGYQPMRCFNTGVFGARPQQWKEIYQKYVEHFPVLDPMLTHYAKQQWLLSWILQKYQFPIHDTLSDFVKNIHTHGHEPMKSRRLAENNIQNRNGYFYRGETPLLFAHNLR
jgi:hypothetical protein